MNNRPLHPLAKKGVDRFITTKQLGKVKWWQFLKRWRLNKKLEKINNS